MCCCTLLPHCYTQVGDSGTLVCSHHPADSQVTKPELSASAGNRVRRSPQTAPCLGGSAVGSAPRYTESIQSEDKLVSEAADMERKDGEETSAEGADSRSGDLSGSPDPVAPAVADSAVGEAESCAPAPGPSEAAVQQEVTQRPQEQIGESGATPGCKCSPSSIPVAPPKDSTSLAAGERTPSYSAVGYLFLYVNI